MEDVKTMDRPNLELWSTVVVEMIRRGCWSETAVREANAVLRAYDRIASAGLVVGAAGKRREANGGD